MSDIQILAPTLLEYGAVRCLLPRSRAVWSGVGLVRWKGAEAGSVVLVCGLAGALTTDLAPGTVLIPEQVGLPDGRTFRCHEATVRALGVAAHTLSLRASSSPLLTAGSLVAGEARGAWAGRGFAAVDMETGVLADKGVHIATVRVILDGPGHDISPAWRTPARALLQPARWHEMIWLGRYAPYYSLRAARVLKAGLDVLQDHLR